MTVGQLSAGARQLHRLRTMLLLLTVTAALLLLLPLHALLLRRQ